MWVNAEKRIDKDGNTYYEVIEEAPTTPKPKPSKPETNYIGGFFFWLMVALCVATRSLWPFVIMFFCAVFL